MLKPLLLCLALVLPALAQTPRPAITGISHLTLFADNIPKSEQFYKDLLGWNQIPANGANSGVRFYANHTQYVELVTPPKPDLADRLDSVAFTTTDAEALRKYLGNNGISVPIAVSIAKYGDRTFEVRDPENNKIQFTQPGNYPPAEPKNAAQRLSTHIMHAGYQVHNRAALDHFYKDILGFHLYWQGGNPDTRIDWVMMQVPNGTDWIEYMLYLPEHPTLAQLGGANHLAPGVTDVSELQKKLEARGWKAPAGKKTQVLGVDGKMQLDLTDPDGTRIEFMEFAPVAKACCSVYTGTQPTPSDTW